MSSVNYTDLKSLSIKTFINIFYIQLYKLTIIIIINLLILQLKNVVKICLE